MRDPARIDAFINKLRAIWHEHPDLRFGQLLLNAVPEDKLYHTEDSTLMSEIRAVYRK